MRYLLDSSEALFGPDTGCDAFEQRLLRFSGPSEENGDSESDEVLYVISGSGAISLGGERAEVAAGSAAYVARGTPWRVEEADKLVVLSVLVRDPPPSNGQTYAIADVEEADSEAATAGRQFRLLAPCKTATQFVGYIPVGRAPDHFHRYDEVVYVLDGVGVLHIGDESAPLRPGSCVHLPARLVHSLENTGSGEMQVLGVFRPAGSPAEAYYPDGTAAQY